MTALHFYKTLVSDIIGEMEQMIGVFLNAKHFICDNTESSVWTVFEEALEVIAKQQRGIVL